MTIEEIVDRIELAHKLRAEATAHRRAARRYVTAAKELLNGALWIDADRKRDGGGVIIAEHFYGAGADQHHQNANGHHG